MSATPPTYEQLYGFVEAVASMTLDRERGFELVGDDAVETHAFVIRWARELIPAEVARAAVLEN